MPQENYVTRLESYISYLKAEERDCDIAIKRFSEGSREKTYHINRRIIIKNHRLRLENLFPDLASED